ncbi:hypothetical protein PIB30_068604 [Stylosanthes scabra]|uniref:Bifunctional inhibitor/plant lipid transfer protein/seed storage helical domain-containing protein n=1 Tax=Stylosanthes scabra TaxID=79078 RepID=A0ABU6VPS5_9FABA|nr:hypothetical protein [Stylosanthes scabra]
MAHTIGNTWLKLLLAIALLVIALLSVSQAIVLCNLSTDKMDLCRAAVVGNNPRPPDEKCCAVVRSANLPCLCKYKSLLPALGINPKYVLALPAECGVQTPLPPSCRG